MQEASAGRRLGRFELLRLLGAGGMGQVWLARQDGLERYVAVKILVGTPLQPSADRLRREAQALARIKHPHVVPVHEVGEEGGLHYYVMDLVDGRSLEEVLAAETFLCRRAAEIARQIAEALAAAHEQGVIHRDVKPANVLLADGSDHITLVDFGVAMSELAPTLTGTGDLLGTPQYMAPEQARGEAYLADARTDVWGVGVTLYEMLTGRKPFDGDHVMAVQSAVLDREPIAPRRGRSDCPRDLQTIVLRCLDKDPARRYPSARALADDLTRFLADEPIHARRASLGYRFGKHVRRHRGVWSIGASAALLGVLGLLGSVIAGRAAQRDRDAAEAAGLVRVARVFAGRGEVGEAWTRLHEAELRFPRAPAVIDAYWAMAELAGRVQGEDDALAQEVWLDRLLEAGPSVGDVARAHWRLGRVYDKHGFVDDARDHYARAVESGALSTTELADARFGLAWTEWLGRRSDAEIGGRVIGAGDLDGDGHDEVFVLEPPRSLVVLGLHAGRLEAVRRWDVPELEGLPRLWKPFPELSVVDVNGDGRPDLLAVADGCFVADLGGTVLRHMLDFEDCTLIKAGDLDGDHRPELVMVNHGLRVVHVARDWSTQQSLLDDLAIDESHVTGIDIADLDGDGRAELVYAGSMWTRYDVRVARVDHGALRMIARGQVGAVLGLTAMDIEGGRGIFAVKSHSFPSPRLFEDDPYLGPSGPMILRLAGGHLERVWFDPLVPATAPAMELKLVAGGRRTRLGPAFVVDSAGGVLHLYFGPGIHPIRRDLRHLGAANLADGGVVIADLDGDGDGELVLGGARVAAYGIGPGRVSPRREHRRTGADWVSIADELRDAGQLELALSAYRAAVAHGADPVVVAFEEGVCLAKAERWDLALARFRDARTGGRHDTPLWRAMLEAAEATADWPAALDVSRALGDTARAARIEKLTEFRTAFVQDFVEPWPAWRVEQPLACRGRTADGALGLSLLPADRGLALPIEWDGSSMEVSAVVALRDVQYAKSIDIDLARDDGQWAVAGEVGGLGGGGELQVHAYIRSPPDRRLPAGLVTPFNVDWSVFPERVKVSLSYIDHIAQWQIAIHDLAGKRLHHAMVRATSRPIPGRYVIRMLCPTAQFLSASIIDLYRFEIRAAPGALRVIPPAASDPPPRCARDLPPASASSPLHRAFALAAAGKIAAAARELAAWRPSASSRPYPDVFELDQYHVSEWEAGLARLALLDEPLASAIVETGKLMPRREWGVLLRRLAYQQDIDSGQTHWREGVLALRHAVAFAPDDPDAWYMLGYCHYRLGGLAAARSAFERAVELAPAIEGRYPKQGGPAILLALITAREHDAGAAARWLKHAARYGGNLDIARRDPTLRELLRGQLPEIVGH